MRIRSLLTYVSIAFLVGGAVTAALLIWFNVTPNNWVPIALARIVAWSGFQILGHFYQGFPSASLIATDFLLVLFGGLQSALVVLLLSLPFASRR